MSDAARRADGPSAGVALSLGSTGARTLVSIIGRQHRQPPLPVGALRPAMQDVYADVLAVRGFTEVVPDVRGYEFNDDAGSEELAILTEAAVFDVQSDTYRRERDMKISRIVLPHIN